MLNRPNREIVFYLITCKQLSKWIQIYAYNSLNQPDLQTFKVELYKNIIHGSLNGQDVSMEGLGNMLFTNMAHIFTEICILAFVVLKIMAPLKGLPSIKAPHLGS